MKRAMSHAALQAAFVARLTTTSPEPRLRERTYQHDGSADRARELMREGQRVLSEKARTEQLEALADLLTVAPKANRAERRASERRARRAAA